MKPRDIVERSLPHPANWSAVKQAHGDFMSCDITCMSSTLGSAVSASRMHFKAKPTASRAAVSPCCSKVRVESKNDKLIETMHHTCAMMRQAGRAW